MSLNRLPDELIRHISEYGGVSTAKNMAQTSSFLRNIYDVPELIRAIKDIDSNEDILADLDTRIQRMLNDNMYEVGYFENAHSRLKNVLSLVRFVLSVILEVTSDPNISPGVAESILRAKFPRWFYVSGYIRRMRDEYDGYWSRESMWGEEQGPNSIEAISKFECMELLDITLHLLYVFDGWVFENMRYKNRDMFHRGILRIMKRVFVKYKAVENLYDSYTYSISKITPNMYSRNEYIDGEAGPSSRYSIASRRPTKLKGKKHRYGLNIRPNININNLIRDELIQQYEQSIMDNIFENKNLIHEEIFDRLYEEALGKDNGSEDVWRLEWADNMCVDIQYKHIDIEGNIEYAILFTEGFLKGTCNEIDGTPSYWIDDMIFAVRDMIYDTITENMNNPYFEEIMEETFDIQNIINKFYNDLRMLMMNSDIVWLRPIQ